MKKRQMLVAPSNIAATVSISRGFPGFFYALLGSLAAQNECQTQGAAAKDTDLSVFGAIRFLKATFLRASIGSREKGGEMSTRLCEIRSGLSCFSNEGIALTRQIEQMFFDQLRTAFELDIVFFEIPISSKQPGFETDASEMFVRHYERLVNAILAT